MSAPPILRALRTPLAVAALLSLAACATPPPPPEPTAAWDLPAGSVDVAPLSDRWWTLFDDPQLNSLVDEALAHNRDLARAMAAVDASRAALRLADAGRQPSVELQAYSTRQRVSENGPSAPPVGVSPVGNDHRVALQVGYELDLWGAVAGAGAAARAELLASTTAQAVLRQALAAQVVQSYAALQSLDAQRRLVGAAVDGQRESLRLQRLRFEAGDLAELAVRQLEAELIGNEANLPQLDRARAEAGRALGALLGRSPQAMLASAPDRAERPIAVLDALPTDVPSDLLQRRPDVAVAEARLRAAGARVAVARAAYFPRIALTATLGSESTELSSLFDGPSLIWGVLASLTQPLWDGGRIAAQDQIARAQQVQAELAYRDAVAGAFREAHDALGAQAEARLTLASRERQAQALQRAAEITALQTRGGDASELDRIEAERAALAAQAAVADARRALAAAQADLFRALGGGWVPPPDAATARGSAAAGG